MSEFQRGIANYEQRLLDRCAGSPMADRLRAHYASERYRREVREWEDLTIALVSELTAA